MRFWIDEPLKVNNEILDRGFILDTETNLIEWREPITDGQVHIYPVGSCSYLDGIPVSLEDGELIGIPEDEYLQQPTPLKWILNLKDESGNIITGHEQCMTGTREEVIRDYLYWLETGPDNVKYAESDIDIQEAN